MNARKNEAYRVARVRAFHLRHGHSEPPTKEYRTWSHIKTRCCNPNYPEWMYYGGRGIKICERWLKFENFLADMGKAPVGSTIERIDVNGNYEPENCKWATMLEQNRNSRQCVYIKHEGLKLCVNEWAERLKINSSTIRMRLRMGFSPSKILHRGRVPRGTGERP